MRAMESGYARFTFIVAATLLSIHLLDLQLTPDADAAHSAQTTAKFFTGMPHSIGDFDGTPAYWVCGRFAELNEQASTPAIECEKRVQTGC